MRSLPHGHDVAGERDRTLALIAARLLDPGSEACHRAKPVPEPCELCVWLLEKAERRAKRHLEDGSTRRGPALASRQARQGANRVPCVLARAGFDADPATVSRSCASASERVVLVGDRGMERPRRGRPAGLDWVSALRCDAIRKLVSGAVQLSVFDERDLVEIRCDAY